MCVNCTGSVSGNCESSSVAVNAARRIRLENQKIENYVDMALYYARSGEVYKDYFIQKTDLQEVAAEVLAKNRLLFIQNHVSASIDCKDFVYTDRKWIGFILEQIALNSVKYCSDDCRYAAQIKRQGERKKDLREAKHEQAPTENEQKKQHNDI